MTQIFSSCAQGEQLQFIKWTPPPSRPNDSRRPLSHATHLIDAESHSVHVFAHLPHSSAVLLDHTHHQTAAGLTVIRVVILLIQFDQKLRVGPEAVCDVSRETAEVRN